MEREKLYKKESKFLSLVLRHRPNLIDIKLDKQGWTDVEILLEKLKLHGKKIDFITLEEVVLHNNKKRFAFNPTKTKIRANQGHSIKVELGYIPQIPPEKLYHGTISKFLSKIFKEGLKKQKRHHVHLSTDVETAINVGKRRGEAVILVISAKKMHEEGYHFYQSENGIWLTEKVPIGYFELQENC